MDLALWSILIFLTLTCILSLRTLSSKWKKSTGQKNLPPGKMGWPILGETLEYYSMGTEGTAERFFFEREKKYSQDVFKTSLLGEPTVVFCGAAGNKFLFTNENKLVTTWWPRTISKIFHISLKGSEYKKVSMTIRKRLAGALKPESLQKYVGIMDSVAKKHLEDYWDLQREVHVLPLAMQFAFTIGCKLFLNIDNPVHIAEFAKPFNDMAAGIFSIPVNFPGTSYNRAIKASNLIREELLNIIRQRKLDLNEKKELLSADDFLTDMLITTNEDGQCINEVEIAENLMLLLIGSHDSSKSTISFIMKYLAKFPDIYNKVLKEQREVANGKRPGELLNWEDLKKMRYSWNVACEVIRLFPPFQGNFREAKTDFTYAGFSIPKGWKLYWSAVATHMNAEYFPEPETFDPSRYEGNGPMPYTYVPFGGGPHMCPGKEYARVEILVFMHNVVRKFRWENICPDEKVMASPVPLPSMGLPIRLYPHSAAQEVQQYNQYT